MRPALIIFQKNLVKGRVKTRLAATVGKDKALDIYEDLVKITAEVCEPLRTQIDIHVYYTDHLPDTDVWSGISADRHLQNRSGSLGEKMTGAFRDLWNCGYREICIIGTDCPYLTSDHILEAFKLLKTNNVVVGPAMDGGFYLLAVSSLFALKFKNITWSTSEVLKTYIENLSRKSISFSMLPKLEDIDEKASYNRYQTYLNSLIHN